MQISYIWHLLTAYLDFPPVFFKVYVKLQPHSRLDNSFY